MKTLTFILTIFLLIGCTKKNDIGLFTDDDRSSYMNTMMTGDNQVVFIATSRSNNTRERRIEHFKAHLDAMKAVEGTIGQFSINTFYNTCRDAIDQLLRIPEIEGVNIFYMDDANNPILDETKYLKDDCMVVRNLDLGYRLLEQSRETTTLLKSW